MTFNTSQFGQSAQNYSPTHARTHTHCDTQTVHSNFLPHIRVLGCRAWATAWAACTCDTRVLRDANHELVLTFANATAYRQPAVWPRTNGFLRSCDVPFNPTWIVKCIGTTHVRGRVTAIATHTHTFDGPCGALWAHKKWLLAHHGAASPHGGNHQHAPRQQITSYTHTHTHLHMHRSSPPQPQFKTTWQTYLFMQRASSVLELVPCRHLIIPGGHIDSEKQRGSRLPILFLSRLWQRS